ncbi:MAG: DNA polymerase III subunit gamma/tau [Oscillospiraceae bacterium]|nr:DNA polymerase III subunit gamma/tau [Oscillospiraceae bacterium]
MIAVYQALYRKYRPRTFDDVVGQEHITETLKNQIRNDKLSHAYLFIGTRGTGKTTCAKILAKAVNCEHPVDGNPCNACPTCRGIDDGTIMDVVELDAASNNGVDNVRALRDEAIFTPAGAKKRVYIIDEVHMLSPSAFNALLKIMEEPPAHLMFILATTELKKVPATILSRCQRYSFKRIDPSVVAGRLSWVAEQEGLHMTPDAAALLGRLADGSMRDGLSLMDQVLGDGNITVDSVLSSTGLAGSLRTVQLMELIQSRDSAGALRLFGELWQDGKDPDMLLEELAGLLRDILLMQAAPHTCEQLLSGNYDDASLSRFTGTMTPAEVLSALETVQDAQEQMGRSRNLRMTVELCLISLCDPSLSDSTASLRARISRLEQQVANGVPVQAAPAVSPAPAKKAAPVREKAAPVQPAVPVDQPDDRPPWEEEPPVRPVIDDRPPWDEPPLPDEPPEEYPPLPEEPPLPVEPRYERRPAPRRDPEPSVPVARDERWTEFMDLARQELKGGVFSLLYQCSGTFGEDELTISAPDFPFGQLSQQANQQKLRDCAAKFYGRSVQVKVVNSESGAPRATRSLDELKKFDVVKFQ